MHFLDAWSSLAPLDLARWLVAPVCVLLAVLLPGRGVSRAAALGVTAVLPLMREMELPAWLVVGWVVLWLVVAWLAGRLDAITRPARASRFAGMESGTVGFLVGVALLLVLLTGVARQDLTLDEARRVAFGVALVCLGLTHLMVRRHALRAVVAFAAFGLGLEMVQSLAREAQVPRAPAGPQVLIATGLSVALAARLALTREAVTGSAWVSDAHDLHD